MVRLMGDGILALEPRKSLCIDRGRFSPVLQAASLTSPAHSTLTGAIYRRAALFHGFGARRDPKPKVYARHRNADTGVR
jgi:hypothetical protein